MTEISTRAALAIGLAVLALVLAGRRKPARPWRSAPRDGRRAALALNSRGQTVVVPVEHRQVPVGGRTPLWRRAVALGGLGILTLVSSALLAMAVALGLSWLVTELTGRLR